MNDHNNNTQVIFAFFTKNHNVHTWSPKTYSPNSPRVPLEKIWNTFALFYHCHNYKKQQTSESHCVVSALNKVTVQPLTTCQHVLCR